MSLSRHSSEKINYYNVEVLRDLSKRAEDVCDLLNREVDKVCKEHHKAAKKKKLEQGPFSKMLKVNVGGQLFLTSLQTLKKDPGNIPLNSRCLT